MRSHRRILVPFAGDLIPLPACVLLEAALMVAATALAVWWAVL